MSVIPKEESAGYRRWQVGSFDAPPPTAAETPASVSTAEGEGEIVSGISLPTAEDIERLHTDAQQEGYRMGFESGQQEGREAGMAEARGEAARLAELADNFQQALAGLDQQVADNVLELALEVARQVVRSTLATQPAVVLPVIREAIGALPMHHGNINIHVHPEDAERLHAQLGNQVGQSGWHLVEDTDVAPGGCIIRAGTSEIDATVATRWRRVLEAIGTPLSTPGP